MAISVPYMGGRTKLWLSTCFDCQASIRSSERFEILPRRALKWDGRGESVRTPDTFHRLASARLVELNKLDPKLKQMREIGEEG